MHGNFGKAKFRERRVSFIKINIFLIDSLKLLLYRLRLIRGATKNTPRGMEQLILFCRIVVKNERGETVLDTLVKPPNEINAGAKNHEVYAYSVARAPEYQGVV